MTESARARPDTSDMAAVHMVFRRSLASGSAFIGSAAGDDKRRELISNYYANVLAFLEVHHDGEAQLVFPLLIERPLSGRRSSSAADQHAIVLGR